MKKQYESINIKNHKYKDIDPYNEEDWDEYEINKNDKFYFYAITKGNDIIVCIATGNIVFNKFVVTIDKCSDKSLKLENKTIKFSDEVKNDINNNQISKLNHMFKDINIILIVNDFKFLSYYKNIHEQIRRYLYNETKNIQYNIQKLEGKMDTIEENVITLKGSIKNVNEYPTHDDISLDKNQYIVVKLKESDSGQNIDLSIGEIVKVGEEQGGYYLNDIENGNRLMYLKKTYDTLMKENYIRLRTKTKPYTITFITNEIDLYDQLIERIVHMSNTDTNDRIEKKRKEYKTLMDESQSKRDELTKNKQKYMDFNFSDISKMLEDDVNK